MIVNTICTYNFRKLYIFMWYNQINTFLDKKRVKKKYNIIFTGIISNLYQPYSKQDELNYNWLLAK